MDLKCGDIKRRIEGSRLGNKDYEIVRIISQHCGASVADKSYFHPDYAIVRNAVGAKAPDSLQYTFPDGRDDGRSIPVAARRGVDLAELSQEASRLSKRIQEDIDEQQRLLKAMQPDPSSLPAEPDTGSPPPQTGVEKK